MSMPHPACFGPAPIVAADEQPADLRLREAVLNGFAAKGDSK